MAAEEVVVTFGVKVKDSFEGVQTKIKEIEQPWSFTNNRVSQVLYKTWKIIFIFQVLEMSFNFTKSGKNTAFEKIHLEQKFYY